MASGIRAKQQTREFGRPRLCRPGQICERIGKMIPHARYRWSDTNCSQRKRSPACGLPISSLARQEVRKALLRIASNPVTAIIPETSISQSPIRTRGPANPPHVFPRDWRIPGPGFGVNGGMTLSPIFTPFYAHRSGNDIQARTHSKTQFPDRNTVLPQYPNVTEITSTHSIKY